MSDSDHRTRIPRLHLRFSLRVLLILTAVIAFAAQRHIRATRVKKAISAIQQYGGKVAYGFECDSNTGKLLDKRPDEPNWLLQIIGSEYVRSPVWVTLNYQQDEFLAMKWPPLRHIDSESNSFKALQSLGPHIRHLDLRFTRIQDLAFLNDFSQLQSLNVCDLNLKSIEPLENCRDLQRLEIGANPIEDYSVLNKLTELRYLSMRWAGPDGYTKMTSLEAIRDCNKLEELHASSKTIRDISALSDKQQLRFVNLSWAPIEDIAAFESLQQLEYLDIGQTRVSDISPLRNHRRLHTLRASGTRISDLSPIRELTELKTLFLTKTPVSDIGPLRKLTKLEHVGVSETNVTDGSLLTTLKNLKRCFVNPEVAAAIGDQIPLGRN